MPAPAITIVTRSGLVIGCANVIVYVSPEAVIATGP